MSKELDSNLILSPLNPAQREAVLHEVGPLLILAGAGSGKTRAITHRVAHLIHQGHPAESLLAITFTNKAAEEMKERMQRLCGTKCPWVSTFHSFCARLLRRHIHQLKPYDNSFTIYDSDDSRSLLKELLAEEKVDRSVWTPRAAQEEISRIKNKVSGDADLFGADYAFGQVLRSIYLLYVERMQERNAVDFDDLLLLTVRLFQEHPETLEVYQQQFRNVLIDEYQDTNATQYAIGKILSSRHRNICITGDPDQSIYKWRGADISNIMNFEHDYPDAKVVMLEQNYRSTKRILHVANALICHNELRKKKDLWTTKADGEPVRVYRFAHESEEAHEIVALIRGLLDDDVSPGEIAIFYRINALSRPLEQELINANIPYSIVGGIEYFLRKEVKDLLAYLRLIDNPRDTESLKRIINVPTRGIGKTTLEKLSTQARAERQGLLECVLGGTWSRAIGKKPASALGAFARLYEELAAKRQGPVEPLVRAVIEATEYEEFLRSLNDEVVADRVENVWELANTAGEYDRAHPEGSLTEFIEMINLLGDVDRWSRSEDRVTLMTLHSAKGLEFPAVVIAGVEDGILPLLNTSDSECDLEEERRLLYVGITRACERLYLSHTASRSRFGRTRAAYPSRFLKELEPPPATETETETGAQESLELDRETEASMLEAAEKSDFFNGESRDESISFEDPGTDDWPQDYYGDLEEDIYPVGARVYHATYGEGEVVRVTGTGYRQRVTVAFDDAAEKQFVVKMAPLKRI